MTNNKKQKKIKYICWLLVIFKYSYSTQYEKKKQKLIEIFTAYKLIKIYRNIRNIEICEIFLNLLFLFSFCVCVFFFNQWSWSLSLRHYRSRNQIIGKSHQMNVLEIPFNVKFANRNFYAKFYLNLCFSLVFSFYLLSSC